MTAANEIVLAMVKEGDTVKVTPARKVNIEREFTVDYITDNGFIYGVSTTCDGYMIPFNWIKTIKIVSSK